MEITGLLLKILSDHASATAIMTFAIILLAVMSKNESKNIKQSITHNIDLIVNTIKTHEKEEMEKWNIFTKSINIIGETVTRLDRAMDKYAITNHDVLNDEIGQIDAVIYMSATSVANILKESLHQKRKVNNDIKIDALISEVANDVQSDRLKYHTDLITKGVQPKTVQLWEEVEAELFEGFMFRITQTFTKLASLNGNGTVDRLIDRECELLRDYLHGEFMKRLKRRLSVIK